MNPLNPKTYTAFEGAACIGLGDITLVAALAKEAIDKDPHADIHIFDDSTSELLELDFRGTVEDVLQRLPASDQPDKIELRGPGRPKLGVVAREVTLLPRHWDWLNTQPGGASVALRKLVEIAKRENVSKDQIRQAQDASYKFMFTMAGNMLNYEEALRALYAGNQESFDFQIEKWPMDIKAHTKKLSAAVFQVNQRNIKSNF